MFYLTISMLAFYLYRVIMFCQNIADKDALAASVFRSLKPGASFGVFDMMATPTTSPATLTFPLPFASEAAGCLGLATPEAYKRAFASAGFEMVSETDKLAFVTASLAGMLERSAQYAKVHGGAAPPLTLAVVMGPTLRDKMANCLALFRSGHMTAAEIAWVKPLR
jgi:ubiquinone/menaquinone biosynthesis C-methylase UbiE